MTQGLALFVNPAAAGGRPAHVVPVVRAELDRLEVGYRMLDTRSIEHAREEALIAAAEGETVVAIGGDGLVGCLAGALQGTDSALGIVPAGRGNDLARVLGIPRDDAGAAARIVVDGKERRIDVGAVNGKPFVGIATVGFDSEANKTANEARYVKGDLVYLYAGLRTLAGWKHAAFDVTVDGQRHTMRGFNVAVANSKAYGGGMMLVPHAQLDDGRLDVMMVQAHSKLRWLASVPKVFKGTHVDNPAIRWLTGAEVEISADRPFTVYADGDPIADLPATISVARQCLRVIVP
ncbi:MAG: diacylglycerol/lipid kinase family protein [Thermoleophilaceae bacterium]